MIARLKLNGLGNNMMKKINIVIIIAVVKTDLYFAVNIIEMAKII